MKQRMFVRPTLSCADLALREWALIGAQKHLVRDRNDVPVLQVCQIRVTTRLHSNDASCSQQGDSAVPHECVGAGIVLNMNISKGRPPLANIPDACPGV